MGNKYCCCAKPKEKSHPLGVAPKKCGKSSKHKLFSGKRSTVDVAETSEVTQGSLNDAVGIEQLFKAYDSTEVNTTSESQVSIDNDIDENVTSAEVEDADCESSFDVEILETESRCQQKNEAQSVVKIVSVTFEKTKDVPREKIEVHSVTDISSTTFKTEDVSQKNNEVQSVKEIIVSERQTAVVPKEKSVAHSDLPISVARVEKKELASEEKSDVQSDTDIEADATRETSSVCQQNDVFSVLDIDVADASSRQKNCVQTATAEKDANMFDVEHIQHCVEEASSVTKTESKCCTSKDAQNVEDQSEVLGDAVEKEIPQNTALAEHMNMCSTEVSSTIRSQEMVTTGSQNAKQTIEEFSTDFQNPEAGNKEVKKPPLDIPEHGSEKPQKGGQLEENYPDTETTDKVIVDSELAEKTVVDNKAQVDKLVVGGSQTSDAKVVDSGYWSELHTNTKIVGGTSRSNNIDKGESVNDKTAEKAELVRIPDSSSEKNQCQLIENVIKITGNASNPSTSAVKPPSDLSILQKEFANLPNLLAHKTDNKRPVETTSEHEKMRLACLSLMKSLNLPVSMLKPGNLSIRQTESASVMSTTSRETRKEQEIDETTSQTVCLSTASTPNLTTAQRDAVHVISPSVSTCDTDSTTEKTPVLKKVSDFAVPKRIYVSPFKINTFKKRPKHMFAIPAVAKPDVACKEDIRWKQVESSNPQAQLPWICRSPRFDVAFPPLGKRLFKRMGSIATMQKNRVIPQTLNIEILKLEDNRFPGLRVGALRKGRDKYSFELPKNDFNQDDS